MPLVFRRLLPATLLTVALPLLAQQGAFNFKHFRQYPASGQWSTQTIATSDGKPLAPPSTSSACVSPMSTARKAEIMKLGNDAAATCKMTVLHDEDSLAEVNQICTGPAAQTIHTTLHAIDDKTIAIEVRSAIAGRPETVVHSTSRYLGVCTPAQAAEAEAANTAPLPSYKLTAEECASLNDDRQQAEEGLKGCDTADLSEGQRATCKTSMTGLLDRVKQAQKGCAK